MISRYSRRPVSHNLEIRGVSRSSLDQHPLPEEADDNQVPQRFLHDLTEGVSTHNSLETSAASGQSECSTVITGDTTQSWSGIHSDTGTGVSTERSSVFSWGYDEFDKAASRQVHQMFEEIDKELYEGRNDGGVQLRGLQDECQQWASRFPHLRILGTQLVCPSDEGFQWYATSGKGTSASHLSVDKDHSVNESEKDKSGTELNVQGRKAELIKPNTAEIDRAASTPSGSTSHDTKVIESEGLMEEYLAFDSRDLDDEWEREYSEAGRRRHCLPPVTPYRCRRQAVLDLLFDDVWQHLVGWMEELIQRHWEGCVSDDEKLSEHYSPAQQGAEHPYMLLSALPTLLPKLDQSKVPQLTATLQSQNTKSRGSKHKSRGKSKKQKNPSTVGRVPVGVGFTHQNLNDIIMIQGIPLLQRNLGVLDRAQEPEERAERATHRPGSSALPSGNTRPRRNAEQILSSPARPPQSARRRNPPPRTLLPLVPSLSQPSAAGSMDGVIRGTRLHTPSDRLASPLMPLSRNTLLPPIGAADPESSHAGQMPRHTQRPKGPSSRAHSAVTDEAASLLPRDRLNLCDVFSRPNTTHTYRSDTPYRRSFTALDSVNQGRPGRLSDYLGIGVTGISLGISSSSILDSFSHHPLGHSPIEDEEEPEAHAPVPAVLVPSRSCTRGGMRSSRPGL